MSGFLKLGNQGISLIPCKKDKSPAISDWQDSATTDLEQIEQWRDVFPDGMFGGPAGALNGYWVLDLDKSKPNYDFPDEDKLPNTLRQSTKSGGMHYFFKWDSSRPVRNTTNLYPAVDVRGEGGYVVLSPSEGYKFIPVEGQKYINFKRDVVDAPDWLYEKVYTKKAKGKSNPTGTQVPEKELVEMLNLLDPTDPEFESRDGWQEIMRAVHAGSHGEDYGRDAFTTWSLRHPGPWSKDVESEIERDWNSYTHGKENATTWGTIIHHLKKRGLFVAPVTTVEDTTELAPVKGEKEHRKIAMHLTKEGKLKATASNLNQLLSAPVINKKPNVLKDCFVYDEFAQQAVVFNETPWGAKPSTPVEDADATELQIFLSENFGVEYSDSALMRGILAVSKRNSNHPVRNYIKGIEWDGKPRIDTWLYDWLGTPKDAYTQAVGAKMLIAGVKRIFEPGCKYDNLVVLEGPQGCRKSTLLQTLGKNWYSAPHLSLNTLADGKGDSVTNCFGSWIIEMEEMASVCQADERVLKKFLSTQEDTLTLKYDRLRSTFKRQFILIGTINLKGDGRYLRDITGGRRIWPITVRRTKRNPIDIEAFKDIVDQLWAEAYVRYKRGDQLHLTHEEEKIAERFQAERTMTYQGIDVVEDWVTENMGKDEDRIHIQTIVKAIWGINATNANKQAVAECLDNMGWEYKKSLRVNGINRSGFIKPEEFDDEID